ncbi:DUF1800 family protein [Luteolibacter yonseiensis]|uniref:DUF1800 family protein n=1 Tax=Luteolibacter yonseiensis TaxID=1144680 RepID=A0A934V9P2_9BACT|nr:DUF1800 family protein [Luteolibacter yonseiensis]MBK1815363.1 DUF1800 family protein [Luteolibacter yonseiensis]
MTHPLSGRRNAVFLTSLLSIGISAIAAAVPKYESGSLTFSQPNAGTWKTVTFITPFPAVPVVVLGTPTHLDPAGFAARVRNVSATGFEYQIDEWDYLDGVHGQETLNYLAIEPGTHTIDGQTWKAGRTTGVTRTAQTVALGTGFTTTPIVLAQVESVANAKAVTSRVQAVTTTNFQVKALTQESDTAALSNESVGWIAIAQASGTLDGTSFQAVRTAANVTDAWKPITFGGTVRQPLIFAQGQTANGSDPFVVRQRNLTKTGVEIFLQEEQSAATETTHNAENVGYLVLGETAGELRSKLQFGELVQAQAAAGTWQTVTFAKSYANPVVVFGPATQNDPEPVGVRVRNVTSTGFEWQFDEWDFQDGIHAQEQVHYVVAEEGTYVIGGLQWQFGRSTLVNNTPSARTFAEAFAAAPAVLTQTVTRNGSSAVKSRLSGVTATGFSVRLEEESAQDQTHADETVHYLAVEQGNGRLVTPPYLSVHAGVTAADVTEFFRPLVFARKLAEPFLFADPQTRNDADPVTPRFANLTAGGADLRLQEETSLEVNIAHTAEKAGFLAVSGALDTDEDGLPDTWELANGLNPNNSADGALDPDGDGLGNLAEQTYGTNPNVANGAGTLTVAASVPDAFEKEGGRAAFLITRSGGVAPATVSFALTGTASAGDYVVKDDRGNTLTGSISFAAGESVRTIFIVPVLDSLNEYPETVALTLSSGAAYSLGSPSTAAVKIKDATDTAQNEQLFVAYLTRQGTAQTYASGIATLYLNGSKTVARVNLGFSGLTSNQVNAYIRYGVTSGIGQELRPTLPIGQVINETWTVNPVGALAGQDLVDGLFQSGGKWIYLNIGTGTYPAGEIAGTFGLQTGSSTFTPPPAAPAPAVLTGDALTRDVSRFLTQATFGATKPEIDALVDSIQTTHAGDRIAGYAAWIEAQFALGQTRLLDYTQAADAHEWNLRGASPSNFTTNNEVDYHNRRRGWWLISAKAKDQLRQRTAFALSEIFVVSEELALLRSRHYGLANYYDQLGAKADGGFRSLLGDVSKSPVMGKYLSHLQNQKTVTDGSGNVLISPDENYAREILQLFSIGLVQLHPDGSLKLGGDGLPIATYGNDDITNLARVFTGWSFSKKNGTAGAGYPEQDNTNFFQGNGPAYYQASWTNPLKNFAAYHDTGAKTVLGTSIAAGLSGQDDLAAALDIIYAHPNVGPFISRQLIQRLVTSNPSRGYVYRVAQKFENNGSGTRGNLKAVIKAILLDPEARDLTLVNQVGYGKQKEPIIRYLQLIRALDGKSTLPLSALTSFGYPSGQLNNFPAGTTLYRYPNTDDQLAQTPQNAPTVFNWFLPGFNPGGSLAAAGLVAPELQLSTETSVIRTTNYANTLIQNNNGQNVNRLVGSTDDLEENVKLDRTVYEQLYDARITAGDTVAQASTVVLDQLDLLLTAGNFKNSYGSAATPNPRSITLDTVASLDPATTTAVRVKELLYLLATSPEYVNQK